MVSEQGLGYIYIRHIRKSLAGSLRRGPRMPRLISVVLAAATSAIVAANCNTSTPIVSPDTNTPETRQSWGNFDINTNYYEVTPDTGRTVEVKTPIDYSHK